MAKIRLTPYMLKAICDRCREPKVLIKPSDLKGQRFHQTAVLCEECKEVVDSVLAVKTIAAPAVR